MVVLVVGGEVALEVQAGHCSPSSPSARQGGVAGARAEELARAVAVLALAVAPAPAAPDLAVVVQGPALEVAPAPVVALAVEAHWVAVAAFRPAMVRMAHMAIHQRVHHSRQVIQIRPQSRHRAIWITTKSQTVKMVRSAVAANQLG